MDLTIQLTPDEAQTIRSARERGIDVEKRVRDAIRALGEPRSTASSHQTSILLQSWIDEGDEEEQRDTFEALREGLNANHSSSRRIFP
jgi:hypothetical protein